MFLDCNDTPIKAGDELVVAINDYIYWAEIADNGVTGARCRKNEEMLTLDCYCDYDESVLFFQYKTFVGEKGGRTILPGVLVVKKKKNS